MSAVGSFADLEVKRMGRDRSLPEVAGYPGFTSGGPPGPTTLEGVEGVFPSVTATTDGGSTTAPGAPTNATVTVVAAMDLRGKTLEQAKVDFAIDALVFVRKPRNAGSQPSYHVRNQFKTVGRLNRWFEGKDQHDDERFGSRRESSYAANEWKMYGTMATPVQEGVVRADEFTSTIRFAGRIRTQDLWCVLGKPSVVQQSLWLLLVRCKYMSPLEKLFAKDRALSLEPKDIRAMNRVENKVVKQTKADAKAAQDAAYAASLAAGAGLDTPDEYQWKWVPYRCPRGSEPRDDLFITGSFIGHAKFIGYVTDVFSNGKSDEHNRAAAEEACFPSDDTDTYQEHLLDLPHVEIQLRRE